MFAKHWCRQLIRQWKKCELAANRLPQWQVPIIWNPFSLLEQRSHHSEYH
jgi:hypothetical protein